MLQYRGEVTSRSNDTSRSSFNVGVTRDELCKAIEILSEGWGGVNGTAISIAL